MELNLTIYNYSPSYTARDDVFESSYDGPDACYFLDERPAGDVDSAWRGWLLPSEPLSEEQDAMVRVVEANLAGRQLAK